MSHSVEEIKLKGVSGNSIRPSHVRMTIEEFDYVIECAERYLELLYQVEEKYPNETRFETAKRLIKRTNTEECVNENKEIVCSK